jgi:Fe-S oxidoreductase
VGLAKLLGVRSGRIEARRDGATLMSKFDYAGYFSRIREIERLVVPADGINWLEKYSTPEKPVDVLLYLGCNVLMTAHLAREVVKVFEAIGVSFAAVGGPQFCCGIVHYGHGDRDASTRLTRATVGKFESFGAREVVMWCPSCTKHFDEVILKQQQPDFTVTHTTAYLAARADRLPFRQEIAGRVAVHAHSGRPQQEADAAAAATLLAAIPGLTVTGAVEDAELDYHCSNVIIERLGLERFRAIRLGLARKAVAQRADTVATIYHSCHREWSDLELPALAVRSYISLVSESLGISEPDRYQEYRRRRDIDATVDTAREAWQSHGLTEQQARGLVRKHFLESRYPAKGSVDSG